jgi:hypothetical protein
VEKAILFIDKLGYDSENTTILAPGKADVSAIQDNLSRRGIKSANNKDDSFSFTAEGLVRVSTLHSSKGLYFPVVLLYLPSLPNAPEYAEAAAGLARNLIYVAMTRAMDNLNMFLMEETRERAVAELVRRRLARDFGNLLAQYPLFLPIDCAAMPLLVDVSPVPYSYHKNHQPASILTKDSPVRSQSKPIESFPFTLEPLQGASSKQRRRVRLRIILCKLIQAVEDEPLILPVNALQILQDCRVIFKDPGHNLYSQSLANLRGRERLGLPCFKKAGPFPSYVEI